MSLVFGKYEKIRRIAQGGMGEVFLARQVGVLDRLAILKSLRTDLSSEKEFVEQFLDEARVAATLNHPNIVSIYDVGEWNGTYYIAMEYVPGEDLSKLWYAAAKAGVGLPFQVSVRICYEAALGLDHAHRARDVRGNPLNIVHRDVSPQNIMVRGDGVVKLVDFGIAKAANKSSRTQAGMVKGKLQYMSPEQVRGETLDGRSDQFSLGVVLWEMSTGRRLFKADTEINTLQKLLQAPIPKPSQHVPGFPSDLEATIMRMLEREAERRYRTLGEVANDLKGYLDRSAIQNGEITVASFVQQILGRELEERTRDLTPMDATEAGVPSPKPRSARGSAAGPAAKVPPNDQPTVLIRDERDRRGSRDARGERKDDDISEMQSGPSDEWQVRKADGTLMHFAEMSTLHQWILDGRVGADDVLSSDGKSWRKIKDEPRLQKFLEIANAALTVRRSATGPVPAPPAQNAEPTVTRPLAAANDPVAADGTAERTDPMAGAFTLGELPESRTGQWSLSVAQQALNDAQTPTTKANETQAIEIDTTLPGQVRRRGVPAVVWMLGGIVGALVIVTVSLAVAAPDVLGALLGGGGAEMKKAMLAAKEDDPVAIDALLASLGPKLSAANADAELLGSAALLHVARARIDDGIARMNALVLDLGGREGKQTVVGADKHRALAYKLANEARARESNSPAALVALAWHTAERGTDDEVKAAIALVRKATLDEDTAALVAAEMDVLAALQEARAAKDLRAGAEALGRIDDGRARIFALELRARAGAAAEPPPAGVADLRKEDIAALRAGADMLDERGSVDPRSTILRELARLIEERMKADVGAPIVGENMKPPDHDNTKPPDNTKPLVVDAGLAPEPETYQSAIEKARRALKAGESRRAIKMARVARELNSMPVEPLVIMGYAYIDTGNSAEAIKAFSTALVNDGGNCDAQNGLAEAYRFQGSTAEAVGAYNKYLDICPEGKDAGAAKAFLEQNQ